MGHWLDSNRGHLIVFLFYLGIGTAFFATSIIYLVNLKEYGAPIDSNCTNWHPRPDDHDNATMKNGTTNVTCDLLQRWQSIGIVGIVYGVICFLVSLWKLYTIFKRLTPNRKIQIAFISPPPQPQPQPPITTTDGQSSGVPGIDIPMPPPPQPPTSQRSRGSLTRAAGGHAVRRAHRHVRQIMAGHSRRQAEDTKAVLTFLGGLEICTEFLIVGLLWLSSFALPLFVAAQVLYSEAIRVDNDKLYGIALAIFCIAIVNLTFVAGSSVVMLMEAEEQLEEADLMTRGGELIGGIEEEEEEGVNPNEGGKPSMAWSPDQGPAPVQKTGDQQQEEEPIVP